MVSAIDLNHKTFMTRDEIYNIVTYDMLSKKFNA